MLVVEVGAPVLMDALGGRDEVARLATRYLRIGVLGVPMALVALAAQGWLRGVGDLRTPLLIVIAANVANVVLEVVLVYGLGTGLDGSAAGTVIAQAGMGAAFAAVLLRAPTATPGAGSRADPLAGLDRRGAVRAQRLAVRLLHAGDGGVARASARRRSAPIRSPFSCSTRSRSCSTRSRSPGR